MSSSSSDSAIFHAAVETEEGGPLSGKIQPIHIHRPSKVMNWAAIGTAITVLIGFSTVIYQRGILDNKVENIDVKQQEQQILLKHHDETLHKIDKTVEVQTAILVRIEEALKDKQ